MTDLFETDQPAPQPEKAKRARKGAAAEIPAVEAPPAEPLEAKAVASVEARAEIVVAEAQANAVALFTDPKRYSEFYDRVKATVGELNPDVSTAKGRDEIRSLAFRVTRSKTALDAAGKGLTEEWRKQTAAVNEARKKMVEELDQLAKEVRAPLTAWERAEEERVAWNAARLAEWSAAALVGEDDTAETVETRGRAIADFSFDPEQWTEEEREAAEARRDEVVLILLRARDRLRREEADRAELERLRAEAAEREERERVEREEREAREAAERAEAEAEAQRRLDEERRAAEVREAAERAAQEERQRVELAARIRREEEEAERRAQEEAAAAARAEEEERQRAAHAAEIAAERERAAQAEREATEARETARKVEEAQAAERARLEEEAEAQRKREANQAHRKKIATEVAEDLLVVLAQAGALIGTKADDDKGDRVARAIVLAIVNREVRHTSISF